MLRERLLGLSRRDKRLLQITVDVLLIWTALSLAYAIRLGGFEVLEPLSGHLWLFIAAPLLAIPVFIRSGMYRAVLRYVGNDALLTIAKAVTFASLLLALAIYWYRDPPALIPRSLVFIYWGLCLVLLGGLRLLMRQYFLGDWYGFTRIASVPRSADTPLVAIYGAGAAGNQLVAALRLGRSMQPVAFIDDNPELSGRIMAGLMVYTPNRLEILLEETGATEILLAMPSVSRVRRREILERLEHMPVTVRSVPGFADLISGKVRVDELQEVGIADLLGRDPVPPRTELFDRCLRDMVVMVTGAGGSIGSELCRQILAAEPAVLVLFEQGEFNLYRIHAELSQHIAGHRGKTEIVPILGSVRDPQRLAHVLARWPVDTLYHAAAYKHVPLVEGNLVEGICNNVQGTLYTAEAAVAAGVKNFVLVSTDKAVRPTNVMGCSKRLAEMVLQALSAESSPLLLSYPGKPTPNSTRFCMVRFGNVLDSSGSVIPLFREQIRRGGPVTVTHPEVTRYFMTIPEAAQLVIQAGAMGQGGDVFVLDMGDPVRIVQLAEKMIHLSGLTLKSADKADGDIEIVFTGLRPGEKLYEELLIGDNVELTEHPMIMRASEDYLPWSELLPRLNELLAVLQNADETRIRGMLGELVEGYQP